MNHELISGDHVKVEDLPTGLLRIWVFSRIQKVSLSATMTDAELRAIRDDITKLLRKRNRKVKRRTTHSA